MIFCIIAWNVSLRFWKVLDAILTSWKRISRNVTARFYKSFPNFLQKLSFKKHCLKYYGKILRPFFKRYSYKTENVKNMSETLQKYFPKVYKESIQKEFLYHCLKCFSKVFGSFWTRFWHSGNAFQETLPQGFTKLSRNFSRNLTLRIHFLKYYGKISKTFQGKIFLYI